MSDVSSARRMVAAFVFLVYGPLCWALQLTLIYGVQSALCAFGFPTEFARIWVFAASAFTMGLAVAGVIWPVPLYRLLTGAAPPDDQWQFLRFVMRVLAALSLLAMLYAAIGAVMLDACGALR